MNVPPKAADIKNTHQGITAAPMGLFLFCYYFCLSLPEAARQLRANL